MANFFPLFKQFLFFLNVRIQIRYAKDYLVEINS